MPQGSGLYEYMLNKLVESPARIIVIFITLKIFTYEVSPDMLINRYRLQRATD